MGGMQKWMKGGAIAGLFLHIVACINSWPGFGTFIFGCILVPIIGVFVAAALRKWLFSKFWM